MNLINAASLGLLIILMFFAPLYVNYLEVRWFERTFLREEAVSTVVIRTIRRLHDHTKASVVLLTLAIDLVIAAGVILFPQVPAIIAGIGLITFFMAYRRSEVSRKCPQCFSTVSDKTTRCPHCLREIAGAWGTGVGSIRADWLTLESRFFRYKCS